MVGTFTLMWQHWSLRNTETDSVKLKKEIFAWVLLNAAVHSPLFEFHFLSSNLLSLSHFLSLCLLIFRSSISFNVPSHLCHILLLPLYILFQFFISLSTSLYMKCDSLTIGIGPCNPARAYVFFDISSASRSVFTDVFIFHFKTFFSNIEREEI